MDFQKDPHWILVQMLFGLVIAAIAQQSARLVALRRRFKDVYPIITHLILVTSVVTTSWVGWNRAEAYEAVFFQRQLMEVFGRPLILSVPFVLTLIDIALVICYFIMCEAVEIPARGGHVKPTVRDETFWLIVVFGGYILWGMVAYGIEHEWSRFFGRLPFYLICLAPIFFTWFCLRDSKTHLGVAAADLGLVAIVFLFRAMHGHYRVAVALAIMAIILLGAAWLVERRERGRRPEKTTGSW